MRLLLFSDMHRDKEAARNLVNKAADVDVVVGAGDYATMQHGLSDTLDVLRQIRKPTVLVAGNSETYEALATACQGWDNSRVLHGSGTMIDGRWFWGVGGAIPVTPFGAWSWDFTEQQGGQLLAECPQGAIIVSHSPPLGLVDRSSRGQHLGSTAVLQAIERCRPPLVVCGHIHESAGSHAMHAATPVVNAGPAGVVWELP